MSSSITSEVDRPRRRSAFREIGLVEEEEVKPSKSNQKRPSLRVRFRSKNDIFELTTSGGEDEWEDTSASSSDDETSVSIAVPRTWTQPVSSHRFALVAFVVIISTLLAQLVPLGKSRMLSVGAAPGSVGSTVKSLSRRQDNDPTNYCKKWSQQSAIVNGTLYLYGGRKTTSASQTGNTWSEFTIEYDMAVC
jgi:hypothetical protein